MDQGQKEKESQSDEQLIDKFKEQMEFYLKEINLNQKKEKTAVILFGKTRVGKSTIYHILKGDELAETKTETLEVKTVEESLIGQKGDSMTKTPNIYSLSQEIDIIDTPGFDDNQNRLDDLTPQIQLLELLKSYKNIILLIVIHFQMNNRECYRQPLFLAENLFNSKEEINTMFNNNRICLIVNQIKDWQLNMLNEWLVKEINQEDNPIQKANIAYSVSKEFYQRLKNIIFDLQILPEKHQQEQFKNNIHDFIKQNRDHEISINFKLSITEQAVLQLQKILIGIRDIFQVEIDQSITKFIQKTQELDELQKKRDQLMQFCQIIDYDIPMLFLNKFYYQDLTKYYTALKYEECKSTKLEELRYLFEQNIIENLLQCLKEIQIDLRQFKISNKNKKQEV
ncbi:unnamed protein product [Paramecium sonneborni]|uniref:G domain-containing protein n=1 Tax=Paramecium sonneborni TaxID=65129 RepID=A0A8S1NC50_9CILI|nr:unnamed protein product [Paramecium sonneborni]